MRVAVVSTVKNEEADIIGFLRAIENQTRKPDLFVLTVAPSTDRTAEIVRDWASLTTLKVSFTEMWSAYGASPGLGPNRSVGRNIAAVEAIRQGAEVLAFTNVCQPEPTWLETLVKPIEEGITDNFGAMRRVHTHKIDMVGGSWVIDAHNDQEEAMGLLTQFSVEQMDTTKISALNMAITAEAFEHIGGFDPTLDTSEDTDFVRATEALLVKSVFEPGAVVKWRPSTLTLRGAVKTYFVFSKTDGKARLRTDQYVLTYLAYLVFPFIPLWLMYRVRKVLKAEMLRQLPYTVASALAMDIARMVGYAQGRLRADSRRP